MVTLKDRAASEHHDLRPAVESLSPKRLAQQVGEIGIFNLWDGEVVIQRTSRLLLLSARQAKSWKYITKPTPQLA